nr:DNA repair protein RecN [SAR324 cluster bacterium]
SMQQLGDDQQQIAEKIASLSKQLQNHAEQLSRERHKQAKDLDRAVVDELRQLGMNKAVFETRIVSSSLDEDKNACTEKGIDKLEFLLSVNPGQDLRSLAKVASGGELSRIMLALKTVLTSIDSVEILIFDEVDSGISGGIAEIVGKKLFKLGERHQALCVTHLPQIAAFAEHHYLVSKQMQDNQTFTKINPLNTESERIHALADLLGGQQITENTMELASEMLHSFQNKPLIT